MLLDFFLSSLVLAGLGRIWRKLQKDIPGLKPGIHKYIPSLIARALTCSFCFTFWLSLLFVLIFNPLHNWLPTPRFYLTDNTQAILSIFFAWMAVGTGAWIVRFIMDELQHLVHYQNHVLKEKTGHR